MDGSIIVEMRPYIHVTEVSFQREKLSDNVGT